MIRLILSGLLLLPTHYFYQPIPVPKHKPIIFEIAPSVYDQSWLSGSITAYYNGHDRMNGELGITASGYDLDNGIYFKGYRVLAADRSIPLGTLIDIKFESGEVVNGVVLDRGGAIHGNHFDMVLESYQECIRFSHQSIQWQEVGRIDIN